MSTLIRTILITGAGSGLGQGLAQSLASSGHSILATDLSIDSARHTLSLLGEAQARCAAFALDVSRSESIAQLMHDLAD